MRLGKNKYVALVAALLYGATGARAQAILMQNGTPPSGSSASMVHQAGNFVGLGTQTPAGPLEIRDQKVAPGSAPNVANIVITQDDGGQGMSASDCMSTMGTDMNGNPYIIPPPYHCYPDNALVLRAAQYNFNGTLTGHNQIFTLARSGSVGIKQTPYTGSAITARGGWIDLERVSSSAAATVGLRLRNSAGTVNHTIGTDGSNRLTITPGVGGTASEEVQLLGGLRMTKKASIILGSSSASALEVQGSSMFDGPVQALNHFTVGGHATMNNGLDVGSALTVGQGATVGTNLNVGSTVEAGWSLRAQYLHINHTPAAQYLAGLYNAVIWGDMLVKRVKVAVPGTTAWSDDVFAKSYRLRSLAEVGEYIGEHQHLPDVPSAEEVVEKGVDLQTMDATLLRKVEELTLYVLAQQKETDELKKELIRRRK